MHISVGGNERFLIIITLNHLYKGARDLYAV